MRAAVLAVLCFAAFAAADNLSLSNADQCKGKCQNFLKKGCNGGSYVIGLCPGGKEIRCCVPTPPARISPDSNGVGAKCGNGGVCQLNSSPCSGTFAKGMCPGKDTVQCCLPKADAVAPPTPAPVTPAPAVAAGSWAPFSKLWQAYPHGEAADVKRRIGGGINAGYITNTCVVRVTRAMTQAGIALDGGFKLANGKNILLVKGADGKGLALRVAEFKQYIAKKYGKPQIVKVNAGNGTPQIPSEFIGKKGVIMFDVRVWDDATGHFDLWDGQACAHNCYFDKAKEVWLWTLA